MIVRPSSTSLSLSLLSGLSGLSGRVQDKTKLLIMLLAVAWVISAIVALYSLRIDFVHQSFAQCVFIRLNSKVMLADVLLGVSVLKDQLKRVTLWLECHVYEKVYRFLCFYKFVNNQCIPACMQSFSRIHAQHIERPELNSIVQNTFHQGDSFRAFN